MPRELTPGTNAAAKIEAEKKNNVAVQNPVRQVSERGSEGGKEQARRAMEKGVDGGEDMMEKRRTKTPRKNKSK